MKKKIFTVLLSAAIVFPLNIAAEVTFGTFIIVSTLTTTSTTIVNYFSDMIFSGVSKQERLQRFLEDNRAQVAADISRGQGGYLDSVAAIVEVYPMQRGEFAALLQQRFDTVFPQGSADCALASGAIIALAEEASFCDMPVATQ